jgi:hypothetical protein
MAKPYMKFVAFTVQVHNMRAGDQAAAYVDYSYINLIDVDGNRYAASPMLKYLATPFVPTTVNPGTAVAGQLIFEVPYDTAPGQIIELRVAPRN